MLKRCNLFIAILLTLNLNLSLGCYSVYGINVELDSTLKITKLGEPLILNEPYVNTLIVDDHEGNLWLLSKSSLWSFSVDSMKWKRCCTIALPDSELVLGFDHSQKRFLFWSAGVGKVYTMNVGDSVLTRDDKSFHHRTQFGHLGLIHPTSGSIYAFGGYGYWETRNITTKYDQNTNEWQIVNLNSGLRLPTARMNARGVLDAKRNQLHVFAGNSFYENRRDLSNKTVPFNDYWILDLNDNTWNEQRIFNSDSLFEYFFPLPKDYYTYNTYNGTIDTINDLAWYTVRLQKNNTHIKLLAFDLKGGFGSITPYWLGDIGNKSFIKYMYYHAPSNRLIIAWEPIVNNDNNRYIYVSAVTLPQPEVVRAYLYQTKNWSQWTYWLPMLVIVLLVGSIGLTGVVMYRRQSSKATNTTHRNNGVAKGPNRFPSMNGTNRSDTYGNKKIHLQLQFIDKPVLQFNHKIINDLFHPQELDILVWLIWNAKIGRNFVLTDIIEQLFWNKNPNLDYVRKQRNMVLKKINEKLAQLFEPYVKDTHWILDRMPIDDRRKREYAFNLEHVEVQSDLDKHISILLSRSNERDQESLTKEEIEWITSSSILSSVRQVWADEIRTWFSRQYQQYALEQPTVN